MCLYVHSVSPAWFKITSDQKPLEWLVHLQSLGIDNHLANVLFSM